MESRKHKNRKILATTDKFYRIYSFIFTKDEFDIIISDILRKLGPNYIESTIIKFLNNYVTNYLNECLKKPNKFLNIIFNYINSNMYLKNNYNECLNEVIKLTTILKEINFATDYDIFMELILNSTILRGNLKYIVDYNKNLVWSSRIDKIFEDEILVSLIDAYCLLNNVNEEKENVDFGNKLIESSYDLYLQDVYNAKVSYSDEELLIKIKNGDIAAKNMLINKHLNFVINIARQYLSFEFDILDLIEEGNIGLMDAVVSFDFNYNCKFTTFAYWKIKKSIQKFICTHASSMKLPTYIYNKYNSFNATYRRYYIQYGIEPSLEELSTIMNISLEEVKCLYWLRDSMIDLDTFKDNLVDNTLDETISLNLMASELKKAMNVCNLTENEKRVIILRYGLADGVQRTHEEIGKILNKKRNLVYDIELTALKKFRKVEMMKSFAVYMDYPDKASSVIKEIKRGRKRKNS